MDVSDWVSTSLATFSLLWGIFIWSKERKTSKQLLYVHKDFVKILYMQSTGNKDKFIKLLRKYKYKYDITEQEVVVYVQKEKYQEYNGKEYKRTYEEKDSYPFS